MRMRLRVYLSAVYVCTEFPIAATTCHACRSLSKRDAKQHEECPFETARFQIRSVHVNTLV